MTAFNYIATAKMLFGALLKEIIAMEAKGFGAISAASLDDALTIQRDLIALEIIRSDVASGGRMKTMVREDKFAKLSTMPISRMVSPPGRALERFRQEFMLDPAANLDLVLSQADYMQNNNIVPESVPPIGTVYCSAQTGLGKDGGALINHQGLNGGLMIQTCCRCILAPESRLGITPLRINPADHERLQEAQSLLNALLEAKRGHTFSEGERLMRWFAVGRTWLVEAGFNAYASTVKEFIEDPKSPIKPR